MAIGSLDIRMAHLKSAYAQIDKRLGALGENFRGLRGELAGVRRELIGRMDRRFFWTTGLPIVSILLPFARSIGH